jgi:hypothetical protein
MYTVPEENQGDSMSRINGDKSRFNRQRKEKIRRRARTRELLKGFAFPKAAQEKNAQKSK